MSKNKWEIIMKKTRLKKLIASSLIAVSVLALNPIGASAEWKKDNNGWWYTEGNSYDKNCWSLIDGKWYYFDYSGYMLHDTIIDGYYLNSNGAYINNHSDEIKKYESLFKDKDWIKKTANKSFIYSNIILDINQDGVSEMLFDSDCGGGLAGETLFVVTYDNGNVKAEGLENSHGVYYGYSSSEEVFFICGGNQGNNYARGYKLENNQCKEVYSCWDNAGRFVSGDATYNVNGQKVSKTEYDASFKKFGKIDKSQTMDGMPTANMAEFN
jgi:hypothetical protein